MKNKNGKADCAMKKKLMLFALMLSLSISSAGVCSAADNYEDVGENQSEWTEQLDRGLVAVPTQNGVYLSWRLQADEDNRFGDGDSNVSFDIYRDGEKIATETNTTNYLDANGTKNSKYSVISSNETEENLTNKINYDKNKITVNAAKRGLNVYAVKYSEGKLDKIEKFDITKTGTSEFTTDFDIDKAFLWDGLTPAENTTNNEAIMMSDGYLTIPLDKPADETIYDNSGSEVGTYSFAPADCSVGDLDGDGEYEIVVKWTSNERDVGNAGYSGTVRFGAYKLDGTKLWENDINLGRNVFSSAHTAQFLVYDFDGDGKAEITCQTSLGSKDANNEYVSKSADPTDNSKIYNLTDEENETADYRGANNGRVITGEEFLTVFDGETGKAIDTINYPTERYNLRCWGKDDGGNRSNRFLATVSYLDGKKPYAVYWRGYYDYSSGRTGVAGVSFDGDRLSVDYQFDTLKGQKGYHSELEDYSGQGNHSMVSADVDNDGKDEIISGALCMEVNDKNELVPKWCSWREHGDAHHIGNYDPTHDGLEYFSVHEHDGESHGKTLDYGMTVYDATTGDELFHTGNSKDTGRGMMANVGAGGYYQITGAGTYIANGGTDFEQANFSIGNNFRIFWDGDLYDELLNSTEISSWNGSKMASIFKADGCVSINSSKANPSLQADLFGDWREEVVYPTTDGNALRVYTTTEKTNYKMKSLMYDKLYREGVATEQTCYNQPPHISYYLSDDIFYGTLTNIELDTTNAKTKYYIGEELDKTGLKLTGKYSDANDKELTDYSVSGYDSLKKGSQTLTVKYLNKSKTYDVAVVGENSLTAETAKTNYKIGEEFDKNSLSVKMLYEDNTKKEVSGYKISGFDNMKVGPQTVTVTYKGIEDTYTATVQVNVTTDLIIENGVVTGYNGTDTEISIPADVTELADNALANSSLTKVYIYNDIALNGNNIFPSGITIACYENSTAYKYATEHNIEVEIIKKGDSITFDEDFYTNYVGKGMLMQSTTAQTLKDEFITYNTVAADSRGSWYKADTYGFKIVNGTDSNYLSVNAGIYDNMNSFNQVYMSLNSPKAVTENQTISFDIMFPSNSGSPYMEIQNDSGTVIDTLSGLTNDVWYRYTLSYENGTYTRSISSGSEDASEDTLNVTTGNTIASYIVFKQAFAMSGSSGMTGIVNIDNVLLN